MLYKLDMETRSRGLCVLRYSGKLSPGQPHGFGHQEAGSSDENYKPTSSIPDLTVPRTSFSCEFNIHPSWTLN